MTYVAELNKISRTPVQLVVLTMDYCGRAFGVSPCTATGVQCYNTFPTCKDRPNYLRQTKLYKYTSASAPLPFRAGERPYIDKTTVSPTEIKDTQTVKARGTINLHDEPDTDVGLDPYYASRTVKAGNASYWNRWIVRNKNFKGRRLDLYDGFLGITEGQFEHRLSSVIANVKKTTTGISIEFVDLLKALDSIDVPEKIDIKLLLAVNISQTEITLYQPHTTTVTGLDAAGYVRIDDEIISYANFNSAQNKLEGCTRGFYGTTAAEHAINGKVQKCRYYTGNPFDILETQMLLGDAGYAAGDIESADFAAAKTFPATDINYEAMVSEPEKLSKLYFEITDLLDCRSWVGENLKITIRRNLPNEPGRSYAYLSDESNLTGPVGVDLNDKAINTRVAVYWNPSAIGKSDEPEAYSRIDIAVDADAESPNCQNATREKKIFCRWVTNRNMQEEIAMNYVRNQATRILFRSSEAHPILDFSVELKDADIKTGGFVIIATDAVLDRHGNAVNDIFQIVKREKRDIKSIRYSALKFPFKRIGFIAPDATADYAAATDAEKENGFISDDKGFISEEEVSYHTW